MLGCGEAGVFPASIKTVAEWFPKRERALATGIFNAGTNVGAILTPLIVPWITIHFGWRWGIPFHRRAGVVWLVFWLILYRKPQEHPRVSKTELALICSDPPEPTAKVSWLKLFPHLQTWAFIVANFSSTRSGGFCSSGSLFFCKEIMASS
jgi:ACS family hexuronate transporter-like MFS transporter